MFLSNSIQPRIRTILCTILGNNAGFSSKGQVNVETWRCIATLRGHSGDVLDMAWSPQDVWLATASIDNTIIIWDANKLPGLKN